MKEPRRPTLERLYHRYLETEDTAAFVGAVARHYLLTTLERLATGGNHTSRRAAIMALGFLGDYSQSAILGRALTDRDRGVRLLADSGIRAELTAGTRVGVHRYSFPAGKDAHLLLDLRSSLYDYPGKILW